MFVRAIGFHRHRAALRGGYGGSLSSGVPKGKPRECFGNRRECTTHLLHRKSWRLSSAKKMPRHGCGGRGEYAGA